jgi:hypothetical protein
VKSINCTGFSKKNVHVNSAMAALFIEKSPREAAKCCFNKPVARQRKLVGPTKKNHFFSVTKH